MHFRIAVWRRERDCREGRGDRVRVRLAFRGFDYVIRGDWLERASRSEQSIFIINNSPFTPHVSP